VCTRWRYSLVDRFRALAYVLRHEASFSLGVAGRRLRGAVDALQDFDNDSEAPPGAERIRLLRNAAYALSACVIQREALGMHDHAMLIAEYGITPEIWHSMGILDRPPREPAGRA
jgi:hypothetical protein